MVGGDPPRPLFLDENQKQRRMQRAVGAGLNPRGLHPGAEHTVIDFNGSYVRANKPYFSGYQLNSASFKALQKFHRSADQILRGPHETFHSRW